MRRIIFALYLMSGMTISAWSVDPKYAFSEIPEPLKKDVNTIVREFNKTFTISAINKANMKVHKVITILNEMGKSSAMHVVGYDKLSKIKDFSAAVYDGNGKLIKRLKNSEIYDQSAYDGSSLYSDNRLKAVDMSQGAYPYTVEFEYEIEYKFLFHIPGFITSV